MGQKDTLAKLDRLLRQVRSEAKDEMVRAVMALPVEPADKAVRIAMIDLLPEETAEASLQAKRHHGPLLRSRRPDAPRVPRDSEEPPAEEEPLRVARWRRSLARTYRKANLWGFLFREHRRILRFGVATGTISRGPFPFTLRLSPEAQVFQEQTLVNQVLPVLTRVLPKVLANGWLHLTKVEYNWMAGLHDLCLRLGAPGWTWESVLPSVLVFWTASDLRERTLDAWNTVCRKLRFPEVDRLGGLDSVRTLLELRTDLVSLPHLLQALQMLQTRRAQSWELLTLVEPGEYFSTDTFDCTPEVQARIDAALAQLIVKAQTLREECVQIRRMRFFLSTPELLADFDQDADRSDPVVWCRGFLGSVRESFAAVLVGPLVLSSGDKVRLFSEATVTSPLARLHTLEEQLRDPTETHKPELVTRVGELLLYLGRTLADALRTDVRPWPPEGDTVVQPQAFSGRNAVDAVTVVARVLFLGARALGNLSLEPDPDREAALKTQARELQNRIAVLAPVDVAGPLEDEYVRFWEAEALQ